MAILLCVFLAVASGGEVSVKVDLDFEVARAILAVPGTEPSDAELQRIASLPGVEAMIRHGSRFADGYTRENFIAGLRSFAAGHDPQPDPFVFKRVRERLAQTRTLLRSIEADPEKFKRDLIARMQPYTPPGGYETKLTLVAGGNSDGFSPGRGQLYVAIDYFRDDREGLVVLAAHELYHAIQSIALERSGVQKALSDKTGRAREATSFLLTTLKEGTGSLVGDPLNVKDPGSYNAWFSEKYRRNLDRIAQNFALFETILFRLANDDVPFRDLYPLGFSGGWDSNLYFVGYRMAKVIEKYDGRAAIAKAWSQSPAFFFKRYAELAAKHPDDREIVTLSASTVKIVEELAK